LKEIFILQLSARGIGNIPNVRNWGWFLSVVLLMD